MKPTSFVSESTGATVTLKSDEATGRQVAIWSLGPVTFTIEYDFTHESAKATADLLNHGFDIAGETSDYLGQLELAEALDLIEGKST